MTPASIDTRALAVELAELIGAQATPPLLTAGQAAELLAVPASWLLAEARASRIPHIRLGRYVRFRRDDLIAWTDDRVSGPRSRKAPK